MGITHVILFIIGVIVSSIFWLIYSWKLSRRLLESRTDKENLSPPGNGNLVKIRRLTSELSQTESALSVSEFRFRTLCEKAPILVMGIDTVKDNFVLWNAECERRTGWKKAEMPNSVNEFLKKLYPNSRNRTKVINSIAKADGVFNPHSMTIKNKEKFECLWAYFKPEGDNVVMAVGFKGNKQIDNTPITAKKPPREKR